MEAEAVKTWISNPLSWTSIGMLAMMLFLFSLRLLGGGMGAYASKKGENLATKEDLKDAIEQIKAIEVTKAGVAHEDWTAREWRSARMRNLEPFVSHVVAAVAAAGDTMHGYRSANVKDDDPSHAIKARTLQLLFYPEMQRALDNVLNPAYEGRVAAKDFYRAQMSMDLEFRDFDSIESWDEHERHLSSIQQGLNQLTAEVRYMALGIFNQERIENMF